MHKQLTIKLSYAWALEGGPLPPWTLKFAAKKGVFLVLSGKKQISRLLAPPGNVL